MGGQLDSQPVQPPTEVLVQREAGVVRPARVKPRRLAQLRGHVGVRVDGALHHAPVAHPHRLLLLQRYKISLKASNVETSFSLHKFMSWVGSSPGVFQALWLH
jgi:hypothetical protein